MKSFFSGIKEKFISQNGFVFSLIILLISAFCILTIFILSNTIFAADEQVKTEKNEDKIDIKENNFIFNIDDIVQKNQQVVKSEDFKIEEKELEYITLYEKTDTILKDEIQIYKEGEVGIQENIVLRKFENGVLTSEELIAKNVKKAPISKIVYIGTYVPPVVEIPEEQPTVVNDDGVNIDMPLNKPSGLTLEQFKKVLSGIDYDVNGVFEENAEYFYYIEKQYNINGIFLAALGIHESGWAKSHISQDKKNLFGYGANDSNPYNNAYEFDEYQEGIDLVARVLVKYYINEPGTAIYDNLEASGCYYNGPTLDGINVRYSTDDNWANAVYRWMEFLYSRL